MNNRLVVERSTRASGRWLPAHLLDRLLYPGRKEASPALSGASSGKVQPTRTPPPTPYCLRNPLQVHSPAGYPACNRCVPTNTPALRQAGTVRPVHSRARKHSPAPTMRPPLVVAFQHYSSSNTLFPADLTRLPSFPLAPSLPTCPGSPDLCSRVLQLPPNTMHRQTPSTSLTQPASLPPSPSPVSPCPPPRSRSPEYAAVSCGCLPAPGIINHPLPC